MRAPLYVLTVASIALAGCMGEGPSDTESTAPDAAQDGATSQSCPGHWHSTMKVFVNGREVDFRNYSIENERTPLSSHFHRSDVRYRWHWEPRPPECIPFATAASIIGLQVFDDGLEVVGGDHGGLDGTYVGNATHGLRILYEPPWGPWTPMSASDLNGRQQLDGERLAIVFGVRDAAAARELAETVPRPY